MENRELIKVCKLGGKFFKPSIVSNFTNKEILPNYDQGQKTLYVVSAMEDVTRQILEKIFESKYSQNLHREIKEKNIERLTGEFYDKHTNLIHGLFFENPSGWKNFNEVYESLVRHIIDPAKKYWTEDEIYASILQHGELASSKILSDYLSFRGIHNKWLDARKYLRTNEDNRNATTIMVDQIFQNFFKTNSVLIIEGFIAQSVSGKNTVLGFDGSDTSAAEFTLSFDESEYRTETIFWKDVLGVHDRHPNSENSKVLRHITGDDFGKMPPSRVPVRHDAIARLMSKQRVTRVRSFIELDDPGTIITCGI